MSCFCAGCDQFSGAASGENLQKSIMYTLCSKLCHGNTVRHSCSDGEIGCRISFAWPAQAASYAVPNGGIWDALGARSSAGLASKQAVRWAMRIRKGVHTGPAD